MGKIIRIIAGLLIAAGAFFYLYPMTRRVVNAGNLVGLLLCAGLMAVVIWWEQVIALVHRLDESLPGRLCFYFSTFVLVFSLSYLSNMINVMHIATEQKPSETAAVVVLGCKVRGDQPTPMLRRRLEAAQAYLTDHPSLPCIVTGGKGDDEELAEAVVMRQWLIDHGIEAQRIYVEDRSVNTLENLRNARQIMDAHHLGTEIAIVTDGYHQYRAGVYAELAGLEAGAVKCYTNPLYVPTYYTREFLAITKMILFDHVQGLENYGSFF